MDIASVMTGGVSFAAVRSGQRKRKEKREALLWSLEEQCGTSDIGAFGVCSDPPPPESRVAVDAAYGLQACWACFRTARTLSHLDIFRFEMSLSLEILEAQDTQILFDMYFANP